MRRSSRFSHFADKKYQGKFNLYKTSSGKVVYICTQKFYPKFEIIRMRNTGSYGLFEKTKR